jgi:hypothetical protein
VPPPFNTVVLNAKNLPKNKFTETQTQSKFQQIHFISISDHCLLFEICQTAAGKSMNSQFHEFLNLIFGGFFPLVPTVSCHIKKTSKINLRLWLIIVPK